MVKIDLDQEMYQFTTKNVLDRFNLDEQILVAKATDLKFSFQDGQPYLLEYLIESKVSMIFLFQKLAINSSLIFSLSDETLVSVVNEMLQKYPSNFNLVIDKNTNQILTVAPTTSKLVNWKKIVQVVHEVFSDSEEKNVYLTTYSGLGISIVMSPDNSDTDVIRIEPQTASSIMIYRGFARESISLKGYDETEILQNLKEKLKLMLDVDPSISQNYNLVKD